jgi:hypothetical protein
LAIFIRILEIRRKVDEQRCKQIKKQPEWHKLNVQTELIGGSIYVFA